MSALAAWSYTATATHWPRLSRDDWTGALTWGAPESFDCDYSAEAKRMTDSKGVEFIARQIIYTERDTIKVGDMLLIGESAAADPIAAGALDVRAVTRHADTFERLVDDWQIAA